MITWYLIVEIWEHDDIGQMIRQEENKPQWTKLQK